MAGLNPLKMARLQIGISQWHVAKETGISQSLVSLYERGLREPKPEHKKALAKLYSDKAQELWES
jgi:transcriptional regulator with XRE-family HTH domain